MPELSLSLSFASNFFNCFVSISCSLSRVQFDQPASRMASVRRTFLPLVLLGMAALYGGPAFQAVQSQGWPMHAEFCITAGNEELHSCSLKAAGSRRPKPG